jgi:hypothetical protein
MSDITATVPKQRVATATLSFTTFPFIAQSVVWLIVITSVAIIP